MTSKSRTQHEMRDSIRMCFLPQSSYVRPTLENKNLKASLR